MLDNLTQRLAKVVKTMRGEARLTESNTADMLREVRLALLEADVALPAVRDFIARVKEKALGEQVVGSLTPGQALVGVVHEELASLMGADLGPEASQLSFATQPPAIILMAGLQQRLGSCRQSLRKSALNFSPPVRLTSRSISRSLRSTTQKSITTMSSSLILPVVWVLMKR